MKKFVHSLLLLAIAVAVFLTGAGVTIVNYCCSTCSEQTLLMTSGHTCCLMGQSNENDGHSCCSSANKEEGCESHSATHGEEEHCSASRLSFDLDSSMFRPHVATPFVWISDASLFLSSLLTTDTFDTDYKEYIDTPPKLPPREYLSFIRVLII